MAQGLIKKSKAPKPASRKPKAGSKKGARAYAPKKKSLIEQNKKAKKLHASLTAGTERQLAEKAGHLEMLASGKSKMERKNGGQAAARKS